MFQFLVIVNSLITLALLHYTYYKNTQFTKIIEINKAYGKTINGKQSQYIYDGHGTIYRIGYCVWALNDGATMNELYKLEEGNHYKVTAYGLNYPCIGLQYTILKAEKEIK